MTVEDVQSGGSGKSEPTRRIIEHGEKIRGQAQGLVAEVQATVEDLEGVLREELEFHPYATLGTAVGVGWLMGGLLPSLRTTGALFAFGSRILMIALAQRATQAAPRQKDPQNGKETLQ